VRERWEGGGREIEGEGRGVGVGEREGCSNGRMQI